jgi:hypothetical protein
MANGVAEILPMQPFPVRLINTSDRERKLRKGMVVGHALPHPLGIVAVADQEKLSSLEQDSSQARTEAEQYAPCRTLRRSLIAPRSREIFGGKMSI